MNILIIEDEPRAARRLARMVTALRSDANICGQVSSITATKRWLSENPPPDLVLLDIQLADGDAFQLLDAVEVTSPIVFCTAFSEYALRAFRVNSIDYLLKPVSEDRLSAMLTKYDHLVGVKVSGDAWRHLAGEEGAPVYRQRFLINGRRTIHVLPVSEVIVVTAWLKMVTLLSRGQEEHPFEGTLTGVVATLDPGDFFQISRQHAIRLSEVARISRDNRTAVVLLHGQKTPLPVSRARLAGLQRALGG